MVTDMMSSEDNASDEDCIVVCPSAVALSSSHDFSKALDKAK